MLPVSTSYCTKRTAPQTFGIFERGRGRDIFPVVDGLTFAEATTAVRRAAIEPSFNPADHFDCYDDSYDAAQAEAEMYAEAWAEYGDRWNGVELVGAR